MKKENKIMKRNKKIKDDDKIIKKNKNEINNKMK